MPAPKDIQDLYQLFLEGNISKEQLRRLQQYFGRSSREDLRSLIEAELKQEDNTIDLSFLEPKTGQLFKKIQQRTTRKQRPQPTWVWYGSAAAIVLLLLSLALWISLKNNGTDIKQQYDAQPGGYYATLTIDGGASINLKEAQSGTLIAEQGILVSKTRDGQLIYKYTGNEQQEIEYHTISTPRGGQYKIILPDNSCVWLNAASSLRFPTRFDQGSRRVELAGEAFFEVTPNKNKPFLVDAAGGQVQVLGTSFNINAYNKTTTTLISGSVQVTDLKTKDKKLLLPGQQATITGIGLRVIQVDAASASGWKDNVFIFHNQTLREVLQQLERWYDIEVGAVRLPDVRVYAEIPRDIKLSEVLLMLEASTNLKFRLKERRLMVE